LFPSGTEVKPDDKRNVKNRSSSLSDFDFPVNALYYPTFMSQRNQSSSSSLRAEVPLDLWRFAREGGLLEGTFSLTLFPRLKDALAEMRGEISFRVQGEAGEHPGASLKARLRVSVSGELPLICQRCLAPVRIRLALEKRLELVDAERVDAGSALTQEELEDETRDFLPVVRGKAGFRSVHELVEDEILLTLPSVPKHDDCALPTGEETETAHPFAALAAFKRRVKI